MRKIISTITDFPYWLAGYATVMAAGKAYAGNGLAGLQTNLNEQMSAGKDILAAGSLVGGIALCGAGLYKIKVAADSQGREPYGPGLWRLGVGGALTALPYLTSTGQETVLGQNASGATGPAVPKFSR